MTTIDIEVEGLSLLTKQLGQITNRAEVVALNVVRDLTIDTHKFAVQGIQRGPASGRIYGKHRASAPGQYPMSDTGRLAASVAMQPPNASNIIGRVGTNVIYGKYLEFGTSGMRARP